MKREILFRAKSVDNGEWIEGNLLRFCWKTDILTYIATIDFNPFDTERTTFRVVPETVGQFTGMRDKYGRKIFEGDIIKISEYPHYCDVVYDIRQCAFLIKTNAATGLWMDYFSPIWSSVDCSYFTDEFEVIGNIHDNPELMNENLRGKANV
ncbi:MAG: YopX family protein [Ruminococcus flavefaciens]|nr:YopX family protein [Ruminococcus flavefaciens]